MPTYEYKCKQCDQALAITRGVSDPDPGYSCPKCNKPMNKVFSLGGISLKGSGFYSTDK